MEAGPPSRSLQPHAEACKAVVRAADGAGCEVGGEKRQAHRQAAGGAGAEAAVVRNRKRTFALKLSDGISAIL